MRVHLLKTQARAREVTKNRTMHRHKTVAVKPMAKIFKLSKHF